MTGYQSKKAAAQDKVTEPTDEPVADVISANEHQAIITWRGEPLPHGSTLYTHPQPKREWVGLTDDEIEYLDMETSGTVHDFVHAIEAALRSKNT